MNLVTDVILPAGHSAVDLALFVLLPVMVVMLVLMRLLEAKGVLDRLVRLLAPLVRPFGLTGLGIFAALQVNLVSFAAPVATLAVMERRGASDRHLAATLAMVFAMAQANASLPLAGMGLHLGRVLLFSLLGGLAASATVYYGFGRRLSEEEHLADDRPHHAEAHGAKGILDVINRAGAEAFAIATGSIPLLVLSLVAVTALRKAGAIDALSAWAAPVLGLWGIDSSMILLTVTKYLAGGTAALGIIDELLHQRHLTTDMLNRAAGFLIHPFDLPGVAILISAGRRVARLWKPAAGGACIGIALRSLCHGFFPG